MAISLVQPAMSDSGASPRTSSGITTTTGNFLLAIVGTGSNTSTAAFDSVTDNKGNTYTKAVGNIQTFASGNGFEIWYCANITGGSGHTVTATRTGDGVIGVIVEEWSGVATSSVLDQIANDFNIDGVPTTGTTGATSVTDELIVAAVSANPGTTGAGSGYSDYLELSLGGHDLVVETKVVSATGAYSGDFAPGSSTSYTAGIATFKGAGATAPAGFLGLLM